MTTPLFLPGMVKIDYDHELDSRHFHVIRWGLVNVGSFVGNLPSAVVTQIATDMQGLWTSHVQPFTTTDVTFVGTTVSDFTSNTGSVETVTAGGTGSETPPTLPMAVAAETHFPIQRRYRGGKPRAYLSGIAEARAHDALTWTTAFTAALEAGWNAWIGGFAGLSYSFGSGSHGIDPINLSKFSGHVERPSAVVDLLTSAVTNQGISAQRRRRGRI